MADYAKYDARVDALVVEARTTWDAAIAGSLSEPDKAWLARALHAEPHKASKIAYERAHTGFAREITVTLTDLERLYQEQLKR